MCPVMGSDEYKIGAHPSEEPVAILKFTSLGIEAEIPTFPDDTETPKHIRFAEAVAHWAGTREAVEVINVFIEARNRQQEEW